MSSPTNGYSPQQVTRNSFNFTSNPFLLSKTARPKSSPVKSKRSKIGPRQLAINEQQYQQQQQQQQQQLEDIPLDSSTPALQDLVIYIDKSVVNRNSLTGIANALAATVLDKWSPSVTHLIHGTIAQHSHQQRQQSLQQGSSLKRHQGQRTPPIISKSLERKMRVVSPAWLTACYNNKERMPESLYPHEMNSHHRMSSLRHDPSMHSMADENPFGLEPDEFATVESCDSEDNDGGPVANDRRVTDYFQPTNNNTRNKKSTTHDGNGNDDQPDNLYTDMNHLDFDDVDHAGNGGITNDRENGKHGTINKGRKDDDDDDNDHAMSMSYSLIEMSQVQPPQQPQFSDGIPHTPPRQQLTYHAHQGGIFGGVTDGGVSRKIDTANDGDGRRITTHANQPCNGAGT
ncbi:hypothetical protein BCR42DRAFT_392339 [Absidia repens]|uniref:BRCT domain-containing protein n=1 Tax=Absidia repens TaxID=90262 RepID=A0A1X2IH11_9FUNG|nr:hypothetical protein BCR42DRAFT_392339 [Absidia repens]